MRVLVLGNYRQTITVVRSLARASHTVVLGTPRARHYTCLSRYVFDTWTHPEESRRSEYLSALASYVRANSQAGLAIFPVGELQLERLAELPEDLRPLARWVMPDSATIATCLDKVKTSALARELGVPLPETRVTHGRVQLLEAASSPGLGFPLIAKRKDSARLLVGRKAQICRDAGRIEWLAAQPEIEGSPLLVQKFVEGYRLNCHFLARTGHLQVFFQQRVARTDAPDGTGNGVESVSVDPSPELRTHCERLVAKLRYSGVGCVQFMIEDATGRPFFLEINPRLDATCALPYYCGIDFPRLALELDSASAPRSYPVGVRAYWFRGDLMGWLHSVRVGELGLGHALRWPLQMLLASLRLPRDLTWDWRDPIPSLYLYFVNTPGIILQRLWRARNPG